jgi:hypothetical protein
LFEQTVSECCIGQESLSLELERVGLSDRAPDACLRLLVGLQRERPLQQRECVLELVAPDRELGGPLEPEEGLPTQALEFFFLSRPGEIRVLSSDRLCVVVGEQRRKVVAACIGARRARGRLL